METQGWQGGRPVHREEPRWDALEGLLGYDGCHDYMWMGEIELDDGRRLHAYKHYNTRRYLHLGEDGDT